MPDRNRGKVRNPKGIPYYGRMEPEEDDGHLECGCILHRVLDGSVELYHCALHDFARDLLDLLQQMLGECERLCPVCGNRPKAARSRLVRTAKNTIRAATTAGPNG